MYRLTQAPDPDAETERLDWLRRFVEFLVKFASEAETMTAHDEEYFLEQIRIGLRSQIDWPKDQPTQFGWPENHPIRQSLESIFGHNWEKEAGDLTQGKHVKLMRKRKLLARLAKAKDRIESLGNEWKVESLRLASRERAKREAEILALATDLGPPLNAHKVELISRIASNLYSVLPEFTELDAEWPARAFWAVIHAYLAPESAASLAEKKVFSWYAHRMAIVFRPRALAGGERECGTEAWKIWTLPDAADQQDRVEGAGELRQALRNLGADLYAALAADTAPASNASHSPETASEQGIRTDNKPKRRRGVSQRYDAGSDSKIVEARKSGGSWRELQRRFSWSSEEEAWKEVRKARERLRWRGRSKKKGPPS